MKDVQTRIGASKLFICGGVARDKFMGHVDRINDFDICNGDKTIQYISTEFGQKLAKDYNIIRKFHADGHSSIYIGDFKLDFSSNFNVPNIEKLLNIKGIKSPTSLQKEVYSRDFTCNSLLLDLDLKKVYDPTNSGFKDIDNKIIKTCLSPEITLTSNKNRVIRAIYIATKLGFDIDKSIIEYVSKNPQIVKNANPKTLIEKMNEAFTKDADKAAYYLDKMNLWPEVPITELSRPYYLKLNKKAYYLGGGGVNEPTPKETKYTPDTKLIDRVRWANPLYRQYTLNNAPGIHGAGEGYKILNEFDSVYDFLNQERNKIEPQYDGEELYLKNDGSIIKKKAYFQGGGGENNPTPKKKKYKSDTKIVDQPRFEEPFYKNYDLYEVPGKHGPGAGHSSMHKYKTVQEFLEAKRKKLKNKYKANDQYQHDDGTITNKANLIANLLKSGGPNYDLGAGLYDNLDKYESVSDFRDNNNIDFPLDEYSNPDIEAGVEHTLMEESNLIGGQTDQYTPDVDFEGKDPTALDYGRDYIGDAKSDNTNIEKIMDKYSPNKLYGLPDGVDLQDDELGDPTNINPEYTASDPHTLIYDGKAAI
jgi:hypothetical protein